MGGVGERECNQTWNCFMCGTEGHFAIAYPKKNKLLVPVVEFEVNLISPGALPYAITRSKAVDERLNIREEYKEAGRAKDKSKKVSGAQWVEEGILIAGIKKKFF